MKILQFSGPFAAGQTFSALPQSNQEYIHLGIQIPFKQPLRYWNKSISGVVGPDIKINGIEYVISEFGILEFDGSPGLSVNFEVMRDLPVETIIDLAYINKEY